MMLHLSCEYRVRAIPFCPVREDMVEEIALTDAVSFLSSVNSVIQKSVDAAAARVKAQYGA